MKPVEVKNAAQVAQDKADAKAMQGKNKAKAEIAFNRLYARYHRAIFYKILRCVKMNKEVAEDLTQEVFVKVYQKIETYNFSTVVSTWLYNIAMNHIIDYKRKENYEVLSIETLKSEFSGDEDVNEIAFQLVDKSADTFKQVIKNERAEAVVDAVNNGIKNKEAQQIITLIFFEEKPYDEVAAQMGMPIGTVKSLMIRAKRELKKYLSEAEKDFTYVN